MLFASEVFGIFTYYDTFIYCFHIFAYSKK